MYSCSEDEPDPVAIPTISASVTDADGAAIEAGSDIVVGTTFDVTLTITAEGGFNTLNATKGGQLQTVTRTDLGLEAGEVSVTIPLEVETFEEEIGTTVNWTFVAVDEEGQESAALAFSYNVVEPPSPDARSYSAILLAAPLGDLTGASFFSSSDGEIYSPADVTGTAASISPSIDFGYYYGSADMASIASPAGFESTIFSAQVDGWNTKNATTILSTELDDAAFTEVVTWADIDAAVEGGTDEEGIITGLAVGDVVAFETVAGKKGLILVTAINGTFNAGDNIEIDVLVQEAAE